MINPIFAGPVEDAQSMPNVLSTETLGQVKTEHLPKFDKIYMAFNSALNLSWFAGQVAVTLNKIPVKPDL